MNANTLSISAFRLNKQKAMTIFYWAMALLAVMALFAGVAEAAGGGGGTSLDELNTWLEDELGGSVGTTIGLVAFLSGLIGAVATRAFMPLIWGMGIGVVLAIFLDVVVTATSAGLPVAAAVQSVGILG